ncbi:MAG: hypothetical protein ACRCV6_08545 [Formosimonas sp.]
MANDLIDKAADALGYSGTDKIKNAVKDAYGAVVGANYELLAREAGEAAGKTIKKMGTVVGSTMDGIEAVQNIRKGNYRDATGNVCSIGGGVVGGAIAGAVATPETLGVGTVPAALAGSYVGGKAGEAGCKWIYDKISQNTPELNEALSTTTLTSTERNNVTAVVNTELPKRYNVNDAYVENGTLSVQYVNANNATDVRERDFDIATVKNITPEVSVQAAISREQTLTASLEVRQQSQSQGMSVG